MPNQFGDVPVTQTGADLAQASVPAGKLSNPASVTTNKFGDAPVAAASNSRVVVNKFGDRSAASRVGGAGAAVDMAVGAPPGAKFVNAVDTSEASDLPENAPRAGVGGPFDPLVKIPDLNIGSRGGALAAAAMNPADPYLAAALFNRAVKPAAEFMESPGGLALTAVTAGTAPEAVAARAVVASVFGAQGVVHAYSDVPKQYQILKDPSSTAKQQSDAMAQITADIGMPAAAFVGAAHEGMSLKSPQAAPVPPVIDTTKPTAPIMANVEGAMSNLKGGTEGAINLTNEVNKVAAPSVEPTVAPVNIGRRPNAQEQAALNAKVEADLKAQLEARKNGQPIQPQQPTQTTNAGPKPETVEVPSGQPSGPAAQVAEGGTGNVQEPAGVEAKGVGGASELKGQVERVIPKGVTGLRNAIMDQERQARGLPPLVTEAIKGYGQKLWDEAMDRIEKDPAAPDRIIDEALKQPRQLTPIEDAIVLREKLRLSNEFDKQMQVVQTGTDPAAIKAATEQADVLSNRLSDIDTVSHNSGAEWGRGGVARQIMTREDMSLASMETRMRATQGGKPLDPGQRTTIAKLSSAAKAVQDAIADHQTEVQTGIHPKAMGIAKGIVETLDEMAAAARIRMRARMGQVSAGLDPTVLGDVAIIGASHLAHGVMDFAEWSKRMVDDVGDTIRPHLKEIYDASRAKIQRSINDSIKQAFQLSKQMKAGAPEKIKAEQVVKAMSPSGRTVPTMEQRNATYQRGAERRISEYERRIGEQDFTPKPANKLVMDNKSMELRAKLVAIQRQYQRELISNKMSQAPFYEPLIHAIPAITRANVLARAGILVKLTAAGLVRPVVTGAEEAIGSVLKHVPVISQYAEKAPRHGYGLNLEATKAALQYPMRQGARDIVSVLTRGDTAKGLVYGRGHDPGFGEYIPGDAGKIVGTALELSGRVHGALKVIPRGMEEAYSESQRAQHFERQGVQLNPEQKFQQGQKAHEDGLRAIFLQNQRITNAVNAGLRALESPDKITGRKSIPGMVGSAFARTNMPVSKVPTNVIGEATEYAVGTLIAGRHIAENTIEGAGGFRQMVKNLGLKGQEASLATAIRKGVERCSPDQADMIMRCLKKGSIGPVLLALGWWQWHRFGGFYEKGEVRGQNELKADQIDLGDGVKISGNMVHHPTVELLQAGATMHRVANEIIPFKGTRGKLSGFGAAALGLAEDVPAVRTMMNLNQATEASGLQRYAYGLAKNIAIPGFLQEWAEAQDKNARGDTVRRAPRNVGEALKTGIPYLRQEVPQAPAKLRFPTPRTND